MLPVEVTMIAQMLPAGPYIGKLRKLTQDRWEQEIKQAVCVQEAIPVQNLFE